MAITSRFASAAVLLLTIPALAPALAQASLFSLSASGTIAVNDSGDPTIPVGTPWSFELRYDAAAPDLDAEFTGVPDPTFGRFANNSSPPALKFFHYQAAGYAVTIDGANSFGANSEIAVTFTTVNALDININAAALFPHLAGGPVSFHADFNAFSAAPIFTSDALPTNTTITAASFDESSVTLLPAAPGVITGSPTTLTLTALPALHGDFNLDGQVDAADIVPMEQALTNLSNYKATYVPGITDPQLAFVEDVNGDGSFNNADLQSLLIKLKSGGGSADSVPEPTSIVLLGIGALAIAFRRHSR